MSPEVTDQSRYFRDLYRVASADLDPDEKISRAIDVGRERLGVKYGVLSYTGDGNYEVVQTNITSGKYAPGSVSDLGDTWCRHVVAGRQLVAFADAGTTDYRDDVAREATGLQCYIGVPVVVDGETFGTLCYSDEEPRDTDFTQGEEQFVTLLGDWVSHELERVKHHRELREQNERLDEFTGIVAHDLRNPLAGAIGFTELALDETTGEAHDFLQRVDRSLRRMESLIGECLVLAKQGTDVGQREETDLAATAAAAWETVTTNDASITVDAAKTVYADQMRLQRLLENLFRNAIEHCQPGVSVTVAGTAGGFSVSDDGPGLPDDVEQALARPDNADDIKQLGLGLLIVQRIASGHGWELSVRSSSGGTTFEFTGLNTAPPAHRERLE